MGELTFHAEKNCMLTMAAGNQSTCLALARQTTVDREIFALKIIRVKIFRVDKFSQFRSIREIF